MNMSKLTFYLTLAELDELIIILRKQRWDVSNQLIQTLISQANNQPVLPEVKIPRVRKPKTPPVAT